MPCDRTTAHIRRHEQLESPASPVVPSSAKTVLAGRRRWSRATNRGPDRAECRLKGHGTVAVMPTVPPVYVDGNPVAEVDRRPGFAECRLRRLASAVPAVLDRVAKRYTSAGERRSPPWTDAMLPSYGSAVSASSNSAARPAAPVDT